MALWRVTLDGRRRWAKGPAATGPDVLLVDDPGLDELLAVPGPALGDLQAGPTEPLPTHAELAVPLDGQEVWAAGVTYERSRVARNLESKGADHYDLVYEAARPELFLKAAPGRSRGPGEPIAIRADSGWDVPEPELGLVVDALGTTVAYLIGNDVSSRSIEGENPLYLPQAKSYDGSCAVGPCLVLVDEAPETSAMMVDLCIERGEGGVCFEGSVGVATMRRTPDQLIDWLFRAMSFPVGVVLLTGTGVVPDDGFTLAAGDLVRIAITGLGELRNPVTVVGRP